MTAIRTEHLAEGVTLYLGDCRGIVPTLTRPAAIISDPPYGQRQNTNVVGKGGLRAVTPPRCGSRAVANVERVRRTRTDGVAGNLHSTGFATVWPEAIIGDDQEFDPTHLVDAADIVLLWGAHRFGNRLPAGTTLVWDKVPTGKVRDQGCGETAWLNAHPPRPLRIYRLLWDGVCVGQAARHEVTAGTKRVHPTQKPEALMAWCIEQARVPNGGIICDPYMGAGSTGVAAVRAGYQFIGIEIEPLYFDTACRRIAEELRRPALFAAPVQAPVQTSMFAAE